MEVGRKVKGSVHMLVKVHKRTNWSMKDDTVMFNDNTGWGATSPSSLQHDDNSSRNTHNNINNCNGGSYKEGENEEGGKNMGCEEKTTPVQTTTASPYSVCLLLPQIPHTKS